MLSIASCVFFNSKACGEKKSQSKYNCVLATTALEVIAGIALVTIGVLTVNGKMTPFCSPAGSYAMIGVGAFSALPGILYFACLSSIKAKEA